MLPGIVVTAAWCVPLLDLIFHMQILSLGKNFICEVRTASSANLLAALEAKIKHMPSLSCFRSLVVWKEATPPNPPCPPPPTPLKLSRESFSVYFIEMATPLCHYQVLGNIRFTIRSLQRKPTYLQLTF